MTVITIYLFRYMWGRHQQQIGSCRHNYLFTFQGIICYGIITNRDKDLKGLHGSIKNTVI